MSRSPGQAHGAQPDPSDDTQSESRSEVSVPKAVFCLAVGMFALDAYTILKFLPGAQRVARRGPPTDRSSLTETPLTETEYDMFLPQFKSENDETRRILRHNGEKPYPCVCSDPACCTRYDTPVQSISACLKHAPVLRGKHIQFVDGYTVNGNLCGRMVGRPLEIQNVSLIVIVIVV